MSSILNHPGWHDEESRNAELGEPSPMPDALDTDKLRDEWNEIDEAIGRDMPLKMRLVAREKLRDLREQAARAERMEAALREIREATITYGPIWKKQERVLEVIAAALPAADRRAETDKHE